MKLNLKITSSEMKTVTMREFRREAEKVLHRIAKGERFILSHRGKAAARLEPIKGAPTEVANDPFLNIGNRAEPSPKGKMDHRDIDTIIYGRH